MNIILLSSWACIIAVLMQCSGGVAGKFIATLPTCPGDNFTFTCTVNGNNSGVIQWRVGGRDDQVCALPHSTANDPHPCWEDSPFTVTYGPEFGTNATFFTSVLGGTVTPALEGTLVECFGPAYSRTVDHIVGNSTLQVVGPDVVAIICHDLSEDVSGAVNVTVSWTLSDGDSADFYLINITTNAPQIPYSGLLNITTGSNTQQELSDFMPGYKYNITVRGICGGHEGSESEPFIVTPQVPDAPVDCNCTIVYNQSSGLLQSISSTWNTVVDPVKPCPDLTGGITQYQISFQNGSVVASENVSIAECTAGTCSNCFQPAADLQNVDGFSSVSVAAENVVGEGVARNCTTQPINITNNLLTGEVVDLRSPSYVTLNCTFLSGFRGPDHCTVQYGTDPTYMNLPYSAESNETSTEGDTVSVVLKERLNSSTVYYYTVSAISGDVTVTVLAPPFTTSLYMYAQPHLQWWHIALIVVGCIAKVAVIIWIFCFCKKDNRKKKCLFLLLVIATFWICGLALWIAVGAVSSNRNVCKPDWSRCRNGLIISAFVTSIVVIISTSAGVLFCFYCNRSATSNVGESSGSMAMATKYSPSMVTLVSPWLLIFAVFVISPGDVTAQLTAAPLICPGDTFTFRCNVGNMQGITIWRVGGGSECALVHSTKGFPIPCGSGSPFIARPSTGFGVTGASLFSSTLSGTATTALDDTLVECFGPHFSRDTGNLVGNSTLQIIGPPTVNISDHDLSKLVNESLNVTVSWTLSGGDSADFYLINITANAPEIPHGGLLNITSAGITQHELTGFKAGYEYNITVCGVTANCGGLVGRESKPLPITPEVPDAPINCTTTAIYNQSSGMLLSIDNSWDIVPDPVDPCPGATGNITQYLIGFHTRPLVVTEIVDIAKCTAGRCSHTFEPPSNPPSSYVSVSVAAENVLAVGAAITCTTQTIYTTNNLLTGEVVDLSSPSNVTFNCTFLSGFTGSAHCTVQYGTVPTYMDLPYSAESTETGTAGDNVSVVLRERLNSLTVYYYTVSAVSGDIVVTVQENFTTPLYNCTVTDLDNATQTEIESPMCENSVSSTSISGGAVCLNGTTVGSTAVYVCSDGYDLMGNEARVCQKDGRWNGSTPQCIPEEGVFAVVVVVIFVVGFVVVVVIMLVVIQILRCRKSSKDETDIGGTSRNATESEVPKPDVDTGSSGSDEPDCGPEENEIINGKSRCQTDGSAEDLPDIAEEEIYMETPL